MYCRGELAVVDGFEGRVDYQTRAWRFRAITGNYARVIEMCMSIDTMQHYCSIPTVIDRIVVNWNVMQQSSPNIRFFTDRGEVYLPYHQDISVSCGYDAMTQPPTMNGGIRYYGDYQLAGMYGNYVTGIDLAKEALKPQKKSRKEQLAESRPVRLARLWKDMYARTGKKPLSIKQLAIN